MNRVSRRLSFLADLTSGPVLADIGCDHGYLSIQAIQNGRVKKAYACDLREGPLSSARKAVNELGLQDRIELRLQDGVVGLDRDVDEIVIAGMGGKLAADILSRLDADWKPKLLLSVHKDAPYLRKWLCENGWKIDREYIVEDGHFYPVIQASAGTSPNLSEDELEFGVCLQPGSDALAYFEKQKSKWKTIEQSLPADKKQKASDRLALIEKRIESFQ